MGNVVEGEVPQSIRSPIRTIRQLMCLRLRRVFLPTPTIQATAKASQACGRCLGRTPRHETLRAGEPRRMPASPVPAGLGLAGTPS